jgi:anti-sigma regulatory factor (Ser/Thr protein kinase)
VGPPIQWQRKSGQTRKGKKGRGRNVMDFVYPKLQTVPYSNSLLRLSQRALECQDTTVRFDLSQTEFISPLGIILLAGTISECLSQGKKVEYIRPTKYAPRTFLSGIGFNKFFKIVNGAEHQVASPKIQLKRIYQIDPLLTEQIIQVFGAYLQLSEGVAGSLKLAINELMMNTFDHSETEKGCYVCAQSYKQTRKIRLCIADFGIGILESLKKTPQYSELTDHYEGIELAVQEGVTSRVGKEAGYGLHHILRFIEVNQGKMYILSGEGKIKWDFSGIDYRKQWQTMHVPFHGTIIHLQINTRKEGLYFLESERDFLF